MHDQSDTIAATATARGSAPRGIVRLAGPDAVGILQKLSQESISVNSPKRLESIPLKIVLNSEPHELPCDLFVWPDERSYTRQPAVEIHTVGSPPLLDALLRTCIEAGARLAEPGEYTLRAFLAGRLDLVQAEAVLAVVDAKHSSLLDTALAQLAGGLSGPLNLLREELLSLLADIEAGLDFVDEEDVRFIERSELVERIKKAQSIVSGAVEQTQVRTEASRLNRVALVGPPNAGKSSLFNALVQRYGVSEDQVEALVADQPGVTRDSLSAVVDLDGFLCDVCDTAGVDDTAVDCPIDELARRRAVESHAQSDLLLECQAPDQPIDEQSANDQRVLIVITKCDLIEKEERPSHDLATSALSGEGLKELARAIACYFAENHHEGSAEVVTQTAARCAESLSQADDCLSRAAVLAEQSAGDELVSLELHTALDALGRVVGAVVTDDVLDQIFGKFCIGK